ncbi:hypothetical protein TWF730_000040 [Orbilia blumenaviensis]|uniref:Uncharacterized protein n=1 Tax=Orbilia blumenaviensis TaxID=1796055 RepID=A0AAV9VMN6_9PEZI
MEKLASCRTPPVRSQVLDMSPGKSKVDSFIGPYAGTSKEPVFFLAPAGAIFPSVAFETGPSESSPALLRDKDVWIDGSRRATKVVIIKSKCPSNPEHQHTYYMELWRKSGVTRVVGV